MNEVDILSRGDALRKLRLTQTELEVLRWVAAGKTSWEVSQILNRSERVANFHVANAMKKLGAATRAQAAAIAVANGLVDLES